MGADLILLVYAYPKNVSAAGRDTVEDHRVRTQTGGKGASSAIDGQSKKALWPSGGRALRLARLH